MLRLLIAKDLRRAWRNPTHWLVFLSMPLLITGLIGLAFGGGGGGLGRIQLAIVDEDDSPLTEFVRSALRQREAGEYLDVRFLDRPEALRQVRDNRISAVLIIPAGFNLSLPGNLVMYLMMNLLIFGGANVAAERRNGVLRRLLVQPPSKGSIVMGKVYGLVLLGVVQITVLLGIGQFLLGVNIAEQWLGILLTLLVFVWVAASLGVLVGSLIAAEEKVIGLCILASLSMAALGGCWWPLELVPAWLRTVAHLLPTGWAMTALHQLITFGGGLAEAARAIGVLVLFGATANLAAARWFRG